MESSDDYPASVDRLGSQTEEDTKDTNPIEHGKKADTGKENGEEDGGINNPPEGSDPNKFDGFERSTYTRMSQRYLNQEVLIKYKIDYMIDELNPEYLLIKRWVPEYEQDFLWAASKELQEKEMLKRKREKGLAPRPFHPPATEPAVVEANRAKRGAELNLEINRIPLEKWLEFKGSDKRGKHVLDVAMGPRSPTTQFANNIASDTSEIIDSSPKEIDASTVPVRLAINSDHVAHELFKIADVNFRGGRNVIIPPWKSLVTHYDAIISRFQSLKRLRSERDAATRTVEETPSGMASKEGPLKDKSSDQNQTENKPKPGDDVALEPCEVCELLYPPHDTPLECLDMRISHLQCLIDFLDNDLKHIFELRRDLATGKVREIAFEDLWHLFNPGDLIVSMEQRQAYRVFHTSGGRPLLSRSMHFEKRPSVTPFRIDCFYIDFDQTHLGPAYEMILIVEYSGKRQITSLNADFFRNRDFNNAPVFPVRFLDNPESIIGDLIQRGRRLQQFTPFSCKRYHGPAAIGSMEYVATDERRGRNLRLRPLEGSHPDHFTSDIIIDTRRDGEALSMDFVDIQVDWRETAEGCKHYGPTRYVHPHEPLVFSDCGCSDIVSDEAIDRLRAERYKEDLHLLGLHDPRDDITDEHLMLLPAVIKAFVLQQRAWYDLPVDLMQDLEGENEKSLEILKKKSGLEDLILPEGYCDLLEALIKSQPRTPILREKGSLVQAKSTDPTGGKGRGPIILLYGGSGLGKTSTAECIAAYTQRPLYPLTCNDISRNAEDMEKYLQDHLNRAREWNCIVLIDDVDSFTTSTADQHGDQDAPTSIVSSFCHALDNYRGTVILTTKNASSASQAVLSRIHVSLHFPDFDQDSTMRVWQKNIDRVRTNGLVNLDNEAEKAILAFAKEQYAKGRRWDGRQIRNCFQTAVSLAAYDAMKQHPEAKKGAEAKGIVPSLTSKMLETAAILTGKLVHSAES